MIKYKLVQRKDMSAGAEPDDKLYYPVLVSNGRVSFDRLCEEVAEQSALTSGDVKNCVDRLIFNATTHLREGRGVDMGDLGSFRLALRSAGAADEASYDASTMMRAPGVVYTPGKKLKEVRTTGLAYSRVATSAGSGADGEGGSPEGI